MKIKKVVFHTSQLNELEKFYREVLKLNCKYSDSGFKILLPKTEIEFIDSDGNAFYHFAFNIPENKIEEAALWLKERVQLISFEGNVIIDFKNWDAHSVYFVDPAGNIVELIARHRLDNTSKEPINGNGLLSVSEVGFPVDVAKSFYNEVNRVFNIPLFDSATDNFTACGDDDGLFIIVKNKRRWFPEQGKAEKFPITVNIDSNVSDTLILENGLYTISSS